MANQVLIAFKTAGLEKAKALAKDIAAKVKEAAKAIKDVEVRKKYKAAQKQIAGERAADIAAQEEQLGLLRRGSALRGRQVAGVNVRGVANQQKEALEKLRTLSGAASTGNISGALTLLGSVPVVGQVAALAAAAAAIVLPVLQKRQDFLDAARDALIRTRIQEILESGDFARRLEEDVQFRDRQARRAVDLFQRTERARAVGGWHPRSGGLIEVG